MMRLLGLLILIIFAPLVHCQSMDLVGGSCNPNTAPACGVTIVHAQEATSSGPTYSFTILDINSARTKPFSVSNALTSGVATKFRDIGNFHIWVFAAPGVSVGASTGLAVTGGGIGFYQFKSGLVIGPGVRILKLNGQKDEMVYSLLIGWGKK
jgi:hypothetical protein